MWYLVMFALGAATFWAVEKYWTQIAAFAKAQWAKLWAKKA